MRASTAASLSGCCWWDFTGWGIVKILCVGYEWITFTHEFVLPSVILTYFSYFYFFCPCRWCRTLGWNRNIETIKMVHLCIAHVGRVLSVKDCINLLAYPVCSCFLPVSSSSHFQYFIQTIIWADFLWGILYLLQNFKLSVLYLWCVKSSLKGYSFTKRWSFENNDEKKPREGCSYAKTN